MPPSLHARRTGLPARYEIAEGDSPLTTVPARTVHSGGEFELDGHRYRLAGVPPELRSADGRVLATAGRAGPRERDIDAGERRLRLSRRGRHHILVEGGEEIGRIDGRGRGARADLTGLDRPLRVFVLLIALADRRRRRRLLATSG